MYEPSVSVIYEAKNAKENTDFKRKAGEWMLEVESLLTRGKCICQQGKSG